MSSIRYGCWKRGMGRNWYRNLISPPTQQQIYPHGLCWRLVSNGEVVRDYGTLREAKDAGLWMTRKGGNA